MKGESMASKLLPTGVMLIPVLVMLQSCGTNLAATPHPPTAVPALTRMPTAPPSPTHAQPPPEYADIIFQNGVIITMVESQPLAEAIAIRGNRIQAVGAIDAILALEGSKTIVVDLQGKTMMPGFVDGHTHVLAFPGRLGKSLEEAQETAIRYGITTVNEMWANEDYLRSLLDAEERGELRLRVNLFPPYNEGSLDANGQSARVKTWFPEHEPILDADRMLRIPGIKIFVDGDFTPSRGCWAVTEPILPARLAEVSCGSEMGDLYWPDQDELNQVVAEAQHAGFRVSFHAMGDRAIDAALDAVEFALAGESNETYRHMIQHNSLLRPDQMTREADLDIIASVRGYAERCDPNTGLKAFGADRQSWYGNRWSLPSLGIHAFVESDFGWTDEPENRFANRTLDPLVNLYGIVTLRYVTEEGSECEAASWMPGEGTPVERGLQMYTVEPAYAVSMEDYIGSLKPGKFADLVILSDNPLMIDRGALKDLQVWMTMIAGKVEYCAQGLESICP
jgi:predicted amidohydrolase YtcJ